MKAIQLDVIVVGVALWMLCATSRLAEATCHNSLECKEGYFCNLKNQLCVAHSGEADCRSTGCQDKGHVCDEEMGRCVYRAQLREGACNDDNPCPESYQECHNGFCVRACKDSRECKEHEHCFSEGPQRGRCVPFGCEKDTDCNYGEQCSNNKCITRVTCTPGDRILGDCGRGRTCTSAGICHISSLPRCERDVDCPNQESCFKGVCVEDANTYARRKEEAHNREPIKAEPLRQVKREVESPESEEKGAQPEVKVAQPEVKKQEPKMVQKKAPQQAQKPENTGEGTKTLKTKTVQPVKPTKVIEDKKKSSKLRKK